MMDDKERNEVLDLSFSFAKRIVKLSVFLQQDHKEFTLPKQILRSGTSIGANLNEAQAALTKKEFVAKCSIAAKEARETDYWLRLLIETGFISSHQASSLQQELGSLIRLLTSIVKTAQQSIA